jgi:hypothetical protein
MAIAMQVFCTPSITKNVFTMLRHSPTFKIYPQVPYMPHIMNLKKLHFKYFKFVMQTRVKGC